jgi:hypothetical protein
MQNNSERQTVDVGVPNQDGPHEDDRSSRISLAFQRFPKRAFAFFVASLSLCILFFIHPLWEAASGVAKEIFITLTVVTGIHFLDRMFLLRDTWEALHKMTDVIARKSAEHHQATQQTLTNATTKKLSEVTKDTEATLSRLTTNMSGMIDHVHDETVETLEQTKAYLRQVSDSLRAMNAVGISRLYSNREEAGADMLKDLTVDGPLHVRLMGISLNDFVQGKGAFGKAWNDLKTKVKIAGEAANRRGDIATATSQSNGRSRILFQLLLIHPYCLGAQLRSKGESRGTDAIDSRLMTDVLSVAKEIERLQKLASRDTVIECRLYQLPPTLFLCSIIRGSEENGQIVSYMQPYFFWNKRKDMPVPVFKCITDPSKDPDDQIPHQLNEHFDLIWQRSSISLEDFRNNHIIGVDRGLRQAGAVNVFLQKSESRQRILQMLKNAKSHVWIQGISLQSYFSAGDLYKEILGRIVEGKICIRVLLIDPECEQAKFRAFRERLFVDKDETLESFIAADRIKDSTLFRHTTSSIKEICDFMEHLVAAKGRDSNWRHNILVRKYNSAPACFMLRVDDRVLVEQYHYGKSTHTDQPEMDVAILGKEMPVFEFTSETDDLFDDSPEIRERKPFRLLEDHYRFAFTNAKDVLPDSVLKSCAGLAGKAALFQAANLTKGPAETNPVHSSKE